MLLWCVKGEKARSVLCLTLNKVLEEVEDRLAVLTQRPVLQVFDPLHNSVPLFP